MAVRIFDAGSGEILGADAALAAPLYLRPSAWWVNSATGSDAFSGLKRTQPLATLQQAITNAATGDTIFLEAGHTQTLTAAISISKSLSIIGGGSAAGIPTVTFTVNAAAAAALSLAADTIEICNVKIAASAQVNTSAAVGKIDFTATALGCRLRNVYVESNGNDQLSGIRLGASVQSARLENCTLVSTATDLASRPTRGMEIASAISHVELIACTFDDGTVGYSTAAYDSSAVVVTGLKIERVNLLRGADMLINASSLDRLSIGTVTGGGRVVW